MNQINKTNGRTLKLMLDRRSMQRVLAFALNEWLRRSIEEPEAFNEMSDTIAHFLDSTKKGELPDYGTVSARYLTQILWDLTKSKNEKVAKRVRVPLRTSHAKRAKVLSKKAKQTLSKASAKVITDFADKLKTEKRRMKAVRG